jgi:hypothetical protein
MYNKTHLETVWRKGGKAIPYLSDIHAVTSNPISCYKSKIEIMGVKFDLLH